MVMDIEKEFWKYTDFSKCQSSMSTDLNQQPQKNEIVYSVQFNKNQQKMCLSGPK